MNAKCVVHSYICIFLSRCRATRRCRRGRKEGRRSLGRLPREEAPGDPRVSYCCARRWSLSGTTLKKLCFQVACVCSRKYFGYSHLSSYRSKDTPKIPQKFSHAALDVEKSSPPHFLARCPLTHLHFRILVVWRRRLLTSPSKHRRGSTHCTYTHKHAHI